MEIVKKEGKCKLDWVFLTSKDEERWIEIDIFKIEKSIFFKNRYCMVWRDISKRIEAENKLKEFNENLESLIAKEIKKNQEQEHMLLVQSRLAQLGEMVSMIAHQWRQPLGAISSSIIDMQMKMVLEKDKDKILSFVKDELNDIESFTQSLTNTINDFRDFYRQDKVSKTVYINEPIEKAFSIIKNSLGVHDIQIEFDIKSNSKVEVFENELMQVFLNIFQNAKENFVYKEIQNPNIKVKAVDKDDFVVITICDNGGGIEEQILEKIFEPYFSTKSEINGTGLGLYMSLKIIVEHHKGKIKAYNTDDGICFLIKLKKGTING
jgi:signal transduction histidine kinase